MIEFAEWPRVERSSDLGGGRHGKVYWRKSGGFKGGSGIGGGVGALKSLHFLNDNRYYQEYMSFYLLLKGEVVFKIQVGLVLN